MKIGLISDIHGNILALEKIYEEFEKMGVEKVLCAGDIIGLGPHPEEVVQFLKSKNNLVAVRGNHEGYLLDGIPTMIHQRPIKDVEINHHKWIHSNLSDASKEFLNSLPKSQNLIYENVKIYMVHYPLNDLEKYKEFIINPNKEESRKLFDDVDADVYIYGHTHIFSENKDNNKLYINLESTGCPSKTNYATVGILNINGKEIKYENLKIEYDVESVKSEINNLKYPFYECVLERFY